MEGKWSWTPLFSFPLIPKKLSHLGFIKGEVNIITEKKWLCLWARSWGFKNVDLVDSSWVLLLKEPWPHCVPRAHTASCWPRQPTQPWERPFPLVLCMAVREGRPSRIHQKPGGRTEEAICYPLQKLLTACFHLIWILPAIGRRW